MAEKVRFNTTITVEVREKLRQAAEQRACDQGDLLETAITAFLATPAQDATPLAPPGIEAVCARLETIETTLATFPATLDSLLAPMGEYLTALEEGIRRMIERCETLLARVPAPPPPKPPPPPQRIATYEAMYGPPETWVDPYPMPSSPPLDPPKRRLFSRLFFKEV